MSSGNTLTLNPGVYTLRGNLSNDGGTIIGEGVTIYFCGSAKLDLSSNNNGVTNLSGPAAGHTFLLFFDPANTGDALAFDNNNVGVHANLTGIIYAPNARMYSTGGSSASLFNVTGDVVVGRIYWSGAHRLNIREGAGPPDNGELEIIKAAQPLVYGARGELITYSYLVWNTGSVPITDIVVTDDRLGAITCPETSLAAGASMVCEATHITTRADVRRGHINNTVMVTGNPPSGPPAGDSSFEAVTFVPAPSISVAKSAEPATYGAVGETITYTYVVTNTGNVPLRRIVLTDTKLGTITCPRRRLRPGRSMTCTATHVTTVADLRAGHITNVATVTGTAPDGTEVGGSDEATVTFVPAPAINVAKSAEPATYGVPGETIRYTYVVTNSGNVPLTGITLSDSRLGTITCPHTRLLPGRSMTCTATHVTTVADMRRGHITNAATVTGHPPTGPPASDSDEAAVTAVNAPAISVTKTAAPATYRAPGETITYTYVVTNSGNAPVSGIALTDSKLGAVTCPATGLLPGRSMTCTATHVTTVADVRAGHITNAAAVTGGPPGGPPVSDSTEASVAVEHFALERHPAMRLVKTASVAGFTRAGQHITYTYRVTNTGNVPLTGIAVTDDKAGRATCPHTDLAIGTHMNCTATYTTTSADVTTGHNTNTGTATGMTPTGGEVTARSTMTLRFTGTPPKPPPFTG